jgi:hypothetical protein
MRAALAGLDEGTFTEGHELDGKRERQVPKEMIGRRLSQEEAKRLFHKQIVVPSLFMAVKDALVAFGSDVRT